MAPRKTGMLRRSIVASLVALALALGAFTVALIGAADGQRMSHELATRLVPAAAGAGELGSLFVGQQTWLRQAVASGNVGPVQTFRGVSARFLQAATGEATLSRGDQPMTVRLAATVAAYRVWLAQVANPQVAALSRGDLAAARAQQADVQRVSPLVIAVRSADLSLQSEITGEEQRVTNSLDRIHDVFLGALIAMVAVIAAFAVGMVVTVRRGLLRPFRELNQAVTAVADGSYGTRIPAVGPAELSDLSRGVELMRTRLVTALSERERTQESLRSLFELAPDAMVATAPDGAITMANAQAVELWGYSATDLIGRQVRTLLPNEWRATMAAEAARYFDDGKAQSVGRALQSAGLRADGSTFPTEVRLSLLPSVHGTLVVAAVRDVTARLAMEAEGERLRIAAEQERLQQRLQQSRRLESLGQLVGGVAHDFNNLLNIIAGYTEFTAEQLTSLSRDDPRLEPVLADVGQVAAAAEQAIRVTRQLLTFSRSEMANREVLDLNEVVQSAGQLLRRSLGEQIDLIISADPDLWPVEADRGQLEQVLVNVALNARDAMPGGGRLTIETGNADVDEAYAAQRPSLQPGRYCRLAVSDTGMGMDAATIERVFEPFFSTKPRSRGTGLGLATVYGIVTGLGGTIDIYSEKEFGTTVSVLLPISAQVAPAPEEPGDQVEDLRGHGEAILLVEDEESLRVMASRILTRNGYQVCAAEGGATAVRRAADLAQPLDLLITDMVMPSMLGIEVAARVRVARPHLPALFISGYAQQVLDFHGIPAFGHDILQKPFTEAALLSRVRRALNRAIVPASRQPL